jgi:hypothetical protein
MNAKLIVAAILIFFVLASLLIYTKYHAFNIKINDATYFYGDFKCQLKQIKLTDKKVVDVSFHCNKAWITFRFSNKAKSGSIISFSRDDSAFLEKSFYFEFENSGKTFDPKNNSIRLKIDILNSDRFKGELSGVIYDPLIAKDSLTILCNINSKIK